MDVWPKRGPVHVRLALLGGFGLTVDGLDIRLPGSAERLIAFLGLLDRPVTRTVVVEALWPERSEPRAEANLRTALWRILKSSPFLVETTPRRVALYEGVTVDVAEMTALVRAVLAGRVDDPASVAGLTTDLLPGWYDDWVLLERERLRHLRLHALESLCERLTGAGRYAESIEAGLLAVAGDPLRESAHLALIRAYVAEGNRVQAVRQYRTLGYLLQDELGIEPTDVPPDLVPALGR